IGLLLYSRISPAFATEIQARLSHPKVEIPSLRVDLGTVQPKFAMPKTDLIQLSVPLTVTGLPADVEAQPDGALVKISQPDGKTGKGFRKAGRRAGAETLVLDNILFIDPVFFETSRKGDVAFYGTVYLTLFGNPRFQPVLLTHTPANVGNGLQCSLNLIGQL